VGVVTRREVECAPVSDRKIAELARRRPAVIYDDDSLREAADVMAREGVGRLPVVARAAPRTVIGIVTRSDLIGAYWAHGQRPLPAQEPPSGGREPEPVQADGP
jgi:predicted transcriptional regulator